MSRAYIGAESALGLAILDNLRQNGRPRLLGPAHSAGMIGSSRWDGYSAL
jgi:hypothetical protein